jgi:intracellular septation protein
MEKIIELAAPILFFVVWVITDDIFISTQVLIGMVCLQAAYEYWQHRQLKTMTKVLLGSVIIMGGLTVTFRDETFILWKPTIMNWIFALVLAGSQIIFRKSILGAFLGRQLQLPWQVWFRLGYGWALGFFLAGCLNLVVAYQFSLDIWMKYKLFGGFAITTIYIILTLIYLNRIGMAAGLSEDQSE